MTVSLKSEEDLLLANFEAMVSGIAETFGPFCEVVLHDFRRSEGSVVAIAGNVTNRRVGGSISRIGLSVIAAGDHAQDIKNYFTKTTDGRDVKSSTLLIRNSKGHVFGSLCINLDISGFASVKAVLSTFLPQEGQDLAQTLFSNNVSQVISDVLQEELRQASVDFANAGRTERVALFQRLDLRGVFSIRGSVPAICDELNISRAAAYSYLTEVRSNAAGKKSQLTAS